MTTITHRWPLTADVMDVVAGLATTNVGGVTFSDVGALFTGKNTKAIMFTKTLSATYSLSFWAKSGGTQSTHWSPFMSASSSSGGGTGVLCGGGTIMHAVSRWDVGKLDITTKIAKTIDGSEHLHIITFDVTTLKYKIDADTTLSGVGAQPVDFEFAIGRMGAYTAENIAWNGTVRDVRIYDGQVLTEAEMAAIYAAGPNVLGTSMAKPQVMTGGM